MRYTRRFAHAGHLLGTAALWIAVSLGSAPVAANEQTVRPPAVAGRFYTEDPARLEAAIRSFLADARAPRPGAKAPLVLVSPHAGYVYSGQIAGDAFRQAVGHGYDLVVILGTKHTAGPCDGVSVYQGRGYRTPLGVAEIDREVAGRLLRADRAFVFEPTVHRHEHSVEVQVPFVQVLFPRAKIVTAVVCAPDPELCRRFGEALASELKGRRALIVASTDLSHYPEYADALAADRATLTAMATGDPDELRDTVRRELRQGRSELSTCACGLAPVLAALTTARRLGSGGGRVISYANSGDSAVGDRARVVGYGAVAYGPGGHADAGALARPAAASPSSTISTGDRKALLAFARKTIDRYFRTETTPLARDFAPTMFRRQGAFVTLKKDGRLRGCIGHLAEDRPLCQVVGAMALQAAFNDKRFSPLRPDELPEVTIEISVLTPMAAVPGPESIEVGRDGIMLRKQGKSAVFLPQVATEQGWDLEQTLTALCRKAGLRPDDWREGAGFYTFQAIVFHEVDSSR